MEKVLLKLITACFIFICFQFSYASPTIVTFNLANYNDHPNWSTRINLIVDAIQKSRADIVVLQEVRFDPNEPSSKITYQNMAEQILWHLNERGDFQNAQLVTQPVMFYPLKESTHNYPLPAELNSDKKSYVWEGVSIISKFPILETGSRFLTQTKNCTDINKRLTQYIKVLNNNQPLYLFNIHFGLDNVCIESNVQETLDYVKDIARNAAYLILGDFNMTPDNPIFNQLRTANLTDLWQEFKRQEVGYTYPADRPAKRIDFIWANQQLLKSLAAGAQIAIIGKNMEGTLFPSDHLGLSLSL